MFYFLSVLILLASIGLVLLVIVQKSKGGGLASPFASTNNIMGVRKTTDVLEKATWWLFGTVAVLCIVSTRFTSTGTNASSRTQEVLEQNAAKGSAPVALPNFGGEAPTGNSNTPAGAPSAPATSPNTPAESPSTPAAPAPAAQ
nr:preprotein translocase subunit SecG [uncultured Porphyromonas sp.]